MRLNQITVPSTDVERAIAFYQKLGMRLIVQALPRYARLELPEGEATFSIHHVAEMERAEGILVYFESERLDAWVEELMETGIHFDEPPTDRRWLWREARLRDPDGNRLVLYFAGKNRKDPPWRQTQKS